MHDDFDVLQAIYMEDDTKNPSPQDNFEMQKEKKSNSVETLQWLTCQEVAQTPEQYNQSWLTTDSLFHELVFAKK